MKELEALITMVIEGVCRVHDTVDIAGNLFLARVYRHGSDIRIDLLPIHPPSLVTEGVSHAKR